ncbi:MAG: DUF3662 domain-containing protein [Anaerolineales bacterium]|jgi:hypothetical protein
MGSWDSKLAQLEDRLRALIEGSMARLFPRDGQEDLTAMLVAAMKAGIQTRAEVGFLAPNLYLVKANPADAAMLLENQSFLQELAEIIHQAGLEAGLHFPTAPVIKVTADPDLPLGQTDVEARLTPTEIGKTKTLLQELSAEIGSHVDIPPNAFLIVDGTKIFPLKYAVINIGRRVDNHLMIDDPRVSRIHAQLRAINDRYVIFDLDSSGGTFVNGDRISKVTLQPGDVISLAGVHLVFGQDAPNSLDDTQGTTRPPVSFPGAD